MSNIEILKQNIVDAFKKNGVEISIQDVVVEKSKDPTHGDYASNAAMKFSRLFAKPPIEVAKMIVASFESNVVAKVEIAGPGFINFFMKEDSLQYIVSKIIDEKDDFGKGEDKHQRINLEFVSANPTGDLHVGHARGAAIGDSLCRILTFNGYSVDREYYINDAGNQITNLAYSLQARYREALGLDFTLPEDGYHGQDIVNIAKDLINEIGDKALTMDDPISYFKKVGIEREMAKIKQDLQDFRVSFDIFSSEISVRSNNAVEKELDFLSGHIKEDNGAKVLLTTEYLDDKDRVIVKSNGDYTYFLPDIVYHVNKLSRGYDKLIDLFGADHHGYINRMKSALMMHGYKEDVLNIELIQMVRFVQDGVEKKASKRSGDAYTVRELIEDVGADAARYFFAMRAPSAHLDFDLALAVEQSSNNPVYYSQYAHARLCSVLTQGKDIGFDASCPLLTSEKEKAILKQLAAFPSIVDKSASELAPYHITNYVHDLAELVHAWYNESKVVDKNNIELSKSRLALCLATKQVIKNALNLVGVNAPEHM